jgi:CRISPR/Cas system-associated endonuclease Cas1
MIRSIHFIEDAGLWLSVRAGELALRQRDGRYVHLDGRIRTIVAAVRGFCVTNAAILFCSARHIELFLSDDAAAFVSLVAPTAIGDARRTALKVREKQFRAAFDPKKTVGIARAIVTAKVKAERHRRETGRAFLAGVQRAKTADDVRHIEAQTAQVWWRQWEGFRMRFADPAVPAEWA